MNSVLSLSGAPRDIGHQHGAKVREGIKAFLASDLSGIRTGEGTPVATERLRERIDAFDRCLQAHLPEISEELDGFAAGAGLKRWEAVLLQYRRELAGAPPDLGECTAVCIASDRARAVLAQNVDLEPRLADHLQLLSIRESGRPEALVLSFAGLLGFLGLNSEGLVVGINFVHANGWKTGISPYLLVRQMLKLDSISACLSLLNSVPIASSRCFTFIDKNSACQVEFTPDRIAHQFGDAFHHTNHYLFESLVPLDTMNPISRNGSAMRLEKIRELTAGWTGNEGAETFFDVLSDHSLSPIGICVHPRGMMAKDRTVASVVLEAKEGIFHLRRGNPCKSQTEVYALDG